MAPTIVASRVFELFDFASEHSDVVLKPLGGKGGQGVIRTQSDAPGLKALLELVTDQEELPVMMQRFLPDVKAGDKRILLVNGKPLGAVNRLPKNDDFRSNLALGGTPEVTEITTREYEICEELGWYRETELEYDIIDGEITFKKLEDE